MPFQKMGHATFQQISDAEAHTARKECTVVDIIDLLRRCQRDDGLRSLARTTRMDRKTVSKYVRLAFKKELNVDCDVERIATEVFFELSVRLPGPVPSKGQVFF